MKKLYILFITFFITAASFGQITINEIDFIGANDFVELSGPVGFDLAGWTLYALGSNGQTSTTLPLSDAFIDPTMPLDPIYNGQTVLNITIDLDSPGGYVLLRNDLGVIVDFIAYGGPSASKDTKPRNIEGFDSMYAGRVASVGDSLQLTDAGWVASAPTEGAINSGQTLSVAKNQIAGFAMYPNPVTNGTFSITSNNSIEKNIEIFSVSGQQVYKNSVKSRENIDISNLTTGSYFIRVEEEGKTATRKLIVN